jgi:hypothetical protein
VWTLKKKCNKKRYRRQSNFNRGKKRRLSRKVLKFEEKIGRVEAKAGLVSNFVKKMWRLGVKFLAETNSLS